MTETEEDCDFARRYKAARSGGDRVVILGQLSTRLRQMDKRAAAANTRADALAAELARVTGERDALAAENIRLTDEADRLDRRFLDKVDGELDACVRATSAETERNALAAMAGEAMAECTRLRADNAAMLVEISRLAQARGEAEGRLKASEAVGVVDGWRERATAAEAEAERLRAENDELRAALKPFGKFARSAAWTGSDPVNPSAPIHCLACGLSLIVSDLRRAADLTDGGRDA